MGGYPPFSPTKSRIERLIATARGKMWRCVNMEKTPKDENDFLNSIHKIPLQAKLPMMSLKQLHGKLMTYSIPEERIPAGMNPFEYLATHEVSLLATDENNVTFYVDGVDSIQGTEKILIPVRIDDKTYYDHYYVSATKNGWRLKIGKCLTILSPYHKNEEESLLHVNIEFNFLCIDDAIYELDFLGKLIENNTLYIGNGICKLCPNEKEKAAEILSYCVKYHDFWVKAKKVFDILHVDYDKFNPSKMSPLAENNIKVLIKAFLSGGNVYSEEKRDNACLLEIDNLRVLVVGKKVDDNEFELQDIYSSDVTVSANFDGVRYNVPIYSALFQDYDTTSLPSNIFYEGLVEAYDKLKEVNPFICNRANYDVLFMLKHYDNNHDKHLLEAALSLCDWILQERKGDGKSDLYIINRLQILKRVNGKLSEDEADEAFRIQQSMNSNNEMKFACSVLLDENKSATRFLKQVPDNRLKTLKDFPIYALYKKGIEKIKRS